MAFLTHKNIIMFWFIIDSILYVNGKLDSRLGGSEILEYFTRLGVDRVLSYAKG